jgi:glyoxylate carboligase
MSQTVSDFFVARLVAWGVKRIYGYPGDGINGVLGALNRAHGQIEFIQVRHEEMAAFMACAHAKFTGEIGVCLSTGGPGASHLITDLYDAKLDNMPVLAICGQAPRTSRGAHYQQELNLDRMFSDVAQSKAGRWLRPRRSIHSGWCASFHCARRSTPSSAATPDPVPTGSRLTCRSAAARCARSPVAWR